MNIERKLVYFVSFSVCLSVQIIKKLTTFHRIDNIL
jgi:hypothetical protein